MGLSRLTSSAASRSCFQLREDELLLGAFGRLPAGQGIGQIDAERVLGRGLFGQGRAQVLQVEAQLQVGHHERRGQNLKAEDPLRAAA